jgi:hypothetical protein
VASKKKKAIAKHLDLAEIRRLVVIAMFSDDVLMDKFVLKGRNALDIVHKLGARRSLNIDLSIPGSLPLPKDARERAVRYRG